MHQVAIRREIIERVLARRGRLHLFERLDAKRTALVVIDMQNAFVAPGAPIEVPGAQIGVNVVGFFRAEFGQGEAARVHEEASPAREEVPQAAPAPLSSNTQKSRPITGTETL